MNLKKIQEIINDGFLPNESKEQMILNVLSEDENLIPQLLEILEYERKRKKKLLSEMNLELSRAHLTIEKPEINEKNFVFNKIVKFYHKNEDQIRHCFANMDKYKEPIPKDDEDKLSWT